jgi:hypothetical protein
MKYSLLTKLMRRILSTNDFTREELRVVMYLFTILQFGQFTWLTYKMVCENVNLDREVVTVIFAKLMNLEIIERGPVGDKPNSLIGYRFLNL